MVKGLISIVLPSRNEPYLTKTIEDLLSKAQESVDVYAILDGWWPEEKISDPRVNYIHYSTPRGMRNAINAGVAASRGEYLMKLDAHCMVAEGYDKVLKDHSQAKRIQIPRRYPLDPVNWKIEDRKDDKYPIDEMLLTPDTLQGVPTRNRWDNSVVPAMTAQGSCWFMPRDYFEYLELMDEETYGTFWQEMQEVGFKAWLSGGEMVTNTNTWYAHWHKTESRGYNLPPGEKEKTREMINKWRSGKTWHKQRYGLDWLFEKFKSE
jgi:glycosyltransferase involved in cell wall biosynthesis